MVNGPKSVFFERDGLLTRSDTEFDDNEHVMRGVERIVSPLGRRVDERSPMVNARLPEGHRVNVIIPPLALNGPTITIRKFRTAIYDLAELVRMGSLPPGLAQLLSWAVRSRLNIAVTGGTGSGKTTLLNALSIEIPVGERILTVEDSAELKFQRHPHVVSLEGRPSNIEGEGEVSIRDLVINALRMRPDRIVVGEVRGGEALDMLQAMNTGHDGSLTTLHANSPDEAVARLVTMVRYVADLPVSAIHEQVSGAIQLFVHQSRMSDGSRRVTHVVQTAGVTDRGVKLEPLVVYRQQGVDAEGRVYGGYEVTSSPSFLDRVVRSGLATRAEVDAWALDR
jgi:pilus assembly protein CpaF